MRKSWKMSTVIPMRRPVEWVSGDEIMEMPTVVPLRMPVEWVSDAEIVENAYC